MSNVQVSGPLCVALVYWDPLADARRRVVLELPLAASRVARPGTDVQAGEWRGEEAERAELEKRYGRTVHALFVVDHSGVVVKPERP